MLITIRVEGGRALPSGDVVVEEAAPVPYAGWLQLLGILSSALPEEPVSLGPGRQHDHDPDGRSFGA